MGASDHPPLKIKRLSACRGNCASFREDVHVIVVGAGFVGLEIAHSLDAYCRVTMIDKREALFVNFGASRAVVETGFEKS